MGKRHNGRHKEPWEENVTPWYRKNRTVEQRIEQWLGSCDLSEVLDAMDALKQSKLDADRILQTIVQRDAQRSRTAKRQLRLCAILSVLAVGATVCWNAASPGVVARMGIYLLMPAWLILPCVLVWCSNYRRHRKRLSNAVALLHRSPRPATTAEMIEAMEVGDAQTSWLAAESLVQQLPQLTEADGAMLQAQHHVTLRRALRGYDAMLILAILSAYEKIGDPSAIPEVRRLTECPTWVAEYVQVREAARRALAVLEADSTHQQTVQTSLRASSPSTTPQEELLRQVHHDPTDTVSHTLLPAPKPHGEDQTD